MVAFSSAGVLQFDHRQRQAVDEDTMSGRRLCLALDHGELVDRQPVVVVGVVEVDQPGRVAGDGAVRPAVLHLHAVDEHAVEGAVVGDQGRRSPARDLAERVVQRLGRERAG